MWNMSCFKTFQIERIVHKYYVFYFIYSIIFDQSACSNFQVYFVLKVLALVKYFLLYTKLFSSYQMGLSWHAVWIVYVCVYYMCMYIICICILYVHVYYIICILYYMYIILYVYVYYMYIICICILYYMYMHIICICILYVYILYVYVYYTYMYIICICICICVCMCVCVYIYICICVCKCKCICICICIFYLLTMYMYMYLFIYWSCSITLGNTTRFVHIGYLIYQSLLIHISAVYDSAPVYVLQSVIAVRVTRICTMYSLKFVVVIRSQSIQ